MKIKTFDTIDYRENNIAIEGDSGSLSSMKEINLIGKVWNLRIVLPKLGLSLWRNYDQKLRINYPSTGKVTEPLQVPA